MAAAALMALPVAASAQTMPPATPPAQTQPAPEPRPAAMQTTFTQDATVDAGSAKQYLSGARDTLSQITAMPEAAKLQGDARTQVTQLIANFNELITTQSNWRAAYGKLDANLAALLGPEGTDPAQTATASGVTGAVGTSGSAGATAVTAGAAQLDPAIRAKLTEFRTHLKGFERAAGSNAAAGTMAPSTATGSSSNPAKPAMAAEPAKAATPATGVMPDSPTGGMMQADQAKAAGQMSHAEADTHLDAISAILNQSKTGTLTKAQTASLKKHVAELRQLLQQSR